MKKRCALSAAALLLISASLVFVFVIKGLFVNSAGKPSGFTYSAQKEVSKEAAHSIVINRFKDKYKNLIVFDYPNKICDGNECFSFDVKEDMGDHVVTVGGFLVKVRSGEAYKYDAANDRYTKF